MRDVRGANREEINRYLVIFLATAPAAVAVYFIFHAVYTNLAVTAKAVGDIDPTTKMGLAMGYVAMVGGTAVLGTIAAWAGFRLASAWIRGRKAGSV